MRWIAGSSPAMTEERLWQTSCVSVRMEGRFGAADFDASLPRPPVQVVRRAAAGADLRVGVDELVVGQLVDRTRLQRAFPVRVRAGRELHREGLLLFVDRVGAELRDGAAHDAGVFLGRGGEPVAGGDLRHLAGDVDLREVALRRENQNAAWLRTERKRF